MRGWVRLRRDPAERPAGARRLFAGIDRPDLVERIEILRAPPPRPAARRWPAPSTSILRKAGKSGGGAQTESRPAAPRCRPPVAQPGGPAFSGRTRHAGLHASRPPSSATRTYAGVATEEGAARPPCCAARPGSTTRSTTCWNWRRAWTGSRPRRHLSPRKAGCAGSASTTPSRAGNTEIGAPTSFPHGASTYRDSPLQGYADLSWTRKLDPARAWPPSCPATRTRDADFLYRGMDPPTPCSRPTTWPPAQLERE
jgi:hypothetical protein